MIFDRSEGRDSLLDYCWGRTYILCLFHSNLCFFFNIKDFEAKYICEKSKMEINSRICTKISAPSCKPDLTRMDSTRSVDARGISFPSYLSPPLGGEKNLNLSKTPFPLQIRQHFCIFFPNSKSLLPPSRLRAYIFDFAAPETGIMYGGGEFSSQTASAFHETLEKTETFAPGRR